jgi:hypothetical protein
LVKIGEWISQHHAGDWASIAGLLVAIVNVIVLLVFRREIIAIKKAFRKNDALSHCGAALTILHDLRTNTHHSGDLKAVQQHYSDLTDAYLRVKSADASMAESEAEFLGSAIEELQSLSKQVSRVRLGKMKTFNFAAADDVIGRHIVSLGTLLIRLSSEEG